MDANKTTDDDSNSVVVVSPPRSEPDEKGQRKITEANDESSEQDRKDEEPTSVEKGEDVDPGMLAESKNLYAKWDSDGNRSWTEKIPEDVEEAAENEQTRKYAVIVRKKKPREADSTHPLVVDSIIVQSPHLKSILRKVLDNYPGISTNVSRLTLSAPFECFVHRWDRFLDAKNDPTLCSEAKEHLELLQGIMQQELGDVITLRQDYLRTKTVSFEHIWTLFPPGCTVLGSENGSPVAVRFNRGYFAKTQCGEIYQLQCEVIDWDGSIMGWRSHNQRISAFLGTIPFSELSCYPLEHHAQAETVSANLRKRGRLFEEFVGCHYKSYQGVALYHPEPDKTRKALVQSRIVIDAATWEKSNPENVYYISQLEMEPSNSKMGDDRFETCSDNSDSESDDGSNDGRANAVVQLDEDKRKALTADQLLSTTAMVRGYALKNKRWMQFFIDQVAEVEFDDNAFDSLVLPEDQKDLILAFATSQVKFKEAFDDIISGKGKGIIMLLSGGPGIGKTLTAESVAEKMHAPLYIMGAGDLGAEADEIEENLNNVLEMVANWNAVLLLDECDVFLEERSANDMQRNRIVSIFLRKLEYYEGILFLTTNRVKNMDPAFQSRIHVSIEYPPLDTAAREVVWKTFLAKTIGIDGAMKGGAAHQVSMEEVERLSQLELNGRQIKNVLKTANLLACHKEEKLAFKHLQTVLRVEGKM